MPNLKEELEKVCLLESLIDDGYEETFAESVVDGLYNNRGAAYICTTPEELSAAIAEMSKEDDE